MVFADDAQGGVQAVLRDVGSLVRYQGELGLEGLSLAPDALRPPAPPGVKQLAAIAAVDLDTRPSLPDVKMALGDCTRCKLSRGRTSIVFGIGDPDARLMFVGEGPGRDEDLQGEPFVGEAGKLLNRMLVAMGLARSEVYIANIVKCRPPRNRDPEPDEVMACEPFLRQQIAAVQPEIVVALGRFAAQTLLCDKTPISRLRGTWRQYAQTRVMPTFHPAYLLRNPSDKKLVWQDLQQVMAQLGL